MELRSKRRLYEARYRDDLGWKISEVAKFFGKPESTIGNALYIDGWKPKAA